MHVLKTLLLVLLNLPASNSESCTTASDCNSGAECEDGTCTNPFEAGCLQYMARREGNTEREFLMRVCNSDDIAMNNTNCRIPNFDYMETRISAQNWDMSIAFSWIYQILLSEIIGVPTTLEVGTGKRDSTLSFYQRQAEIMYPPRSYPVTDLETAHKFNGDCSLTTEPCSHIIPDVWDGGKADAKVFQTEGSILPLSMNGVIGRYGLYIPFFTVMRDLSLLHFIGLQGEENRRKLAERFLTPTTFLMYCTTISISNCTITDDIVTRPPLDELEGQQFHVPGVYSGHFRKADSNDCEKNPTTCVGHIVVPPCSWSTYTETQLYWQEIAMASSGPLEPNGGYSYGQMLQIYTAAAETESDVIIWWWEPDRGFSIYEGTNAAPQRVALPRPTMECNLYRESDSIQRCSDVLEDRLGAESTGSCDQDTIQLGRLYSTGFQTATETDDMITRSPALKYLEKVIMPQYGGIKLLSEWSTQAEAGNYVGAREGVCSFVYKNLDVLSFGNLEGYPLNRRVVEKQVLSVFGIVFGAIAGFGSILTSILVRRWKKERVILYAQPNVLLIVAVGYLFIAIAAISGASEPSNFTCVFTQWGTRLGYTLELTPILLKVSAINKLTREARRLKRSKVDPKRFQRILASILFVLLLYLSIWTGLDMPRQEMIHALDEDDSSTLVSHNSCGSRSNGWELGAFAWECMLLLSATLLTYQSRDVIEELNESKTLSMMVYSHFLFLLMRTLFTVLNLTDRISSIIAIKCISILLALDTIISMCVYFSPKFYSVITNDPKNSSDNKTRRSGVNGSFAASKYSRNDFGSTASMTDKRGSDPYKKPRAQSISVMGAAQSAANEVKMGQDILSRARKSQGSLVDSETENNKESMLGDKKWLNKIANDVSEVEETNSVSRPALPKKKLALPKSVTLPENKDVVKSSNVSV